MERRRCDLLQSCEPIFFMKDPAFLFYPNDFIIGTQFMSDEEIGKYIRILCAMHQHGRLSETQILGICHGILPASVRHKLQVDESGLFFNERLEAEIGKRRKFADNQKVKANKRWAGKSHGNATASATAMPIINENENLNKVISKEGVIGGGFYKPEDFDILPDQYFQTSIEQMKIQKNISISREQVSQMWFIFKNQQLAGDKYYNSKSDVFRHFSNWIKNQKFEQNGKLTKTQQRDQIMQQWITDNISSDGIPPNFGY